MSELKFTPGPYERDGSCVYKLSKDGVNIFSAIVASGYTDTGGRTSADECYAVAQLMVAAPDLLEALKSYMFAVALMNEAMKDGINVHGAISGLVGAEDMANFAIQKATA
ncbi:hypothetical protein QN399_01130 [Pseudomonas sp. 10C3]|uniref:hypothetical protein n=1 Tax=Pseudomonas sp. 10C3 TaxID=3118753 RepID=UPI002E80360A|nr:hypothetical protein [Pseudomonas sp. 10C3]MEE3504878.1 hypothetical protein [Pseudomonas sp. 10C3]